MSFDLIAHNYATVPEAARVLGIHPQSVFRLIWRGDLPAEKFNRTVFINRDVLADFKQRYDPQPGRLSSGKVRLKA